MSVIWHNGAFKPSEEVILGASDLALRGAGVFDTLLVIDAKLCHGEKHFDRLQKNAALFGLNIEENFAAIADDLIAQNNADHGRFALNTIVTAGEAQRGLKIPDSPKPNIIMKLSALPDELPPIEVIISETVRRNEGSPLSHIKSINYGDNILALSEARSKNATEAIMLNNAGNVACTTVGNIFIAKGGGLITPPLSDGAMDGITRGLLIENHGAQEQTITPADLQDADGIYISNSIRGLAAITSLNGAPHAAEKSDIPKDFHE